MNADRVEQVSADQWHAAVAAARADGYAFFDMLTAVDQCDAAQDPGFDVVVHLLDVREQRALRSLRITTRVPDGGSLASLTDLYPGAAWHERETAEMFGIGFEGFADHTDFGLRPLLLPEGFEGHPWRKDFQLVARAVKAWPGGKEPGEGHDSARSPGRRRVQAPGVPPPEWGHR